jgi:hypothetical protein
MLVAGELSRNLGLIDAGELKSLREAVACVGHCRALTISISIRSFAP